MTHFTFSLSHFLTPDCLTFSQSRLTFSTTLRSLFSLGLVDDPNPTSGSNLFTRSLPSYTSSLSTLDLAFTLTLDTLFTRHTFLKMPRKLKIGQEDFIESCVELTFNDQPLSSLNAFVAVGRAMVRKGEIVEGAE